MVAKRVAGFTRRADGVSIPVLEVDETLDERRLLYAYRCLPRNERDDILRRVEVQSLNWRSAASDSLPFRSTEAGDGKD